MKIKNCVRIAALWEKLSPGRRVALHVASHILSYGEMIATVGSLVTAGSSLDTAELVADNPTFEQLNPEGIYMFECSLAAHPDWIDVDLYRHVVGVIVGKEKVGDNLRNSMPKKTLPAKANS